MARVLFVLELCGKRVDRIVLEDVARRLDYLLGVVVAVLLDPG